MPPIFCKGKNNHIAENIRQTRNNLSSPAFCFAAAAFDKVSYIAHYLHIANKALTHGQAHHRQQNGQNGQIGPLRPRPAPKNLPLKSDRIQETRSGDYMIGEKRELFRIQALVDIPAHGVKAGDMGGYMERERCLSPRRQLGRRPR